MVRQAILPVLAVVGFAAAVWAVNKQSAPIVSVPAATNPAMNPFGRAVSGAGVVEPTSESIAVSPAIGGIIVDVFAVWGQNVKAGQPLYQIDARPINAQIAQAKAEIAIRQASVAQAKASLDRLQAGNREEDKRIAAARVDVARTQVEEANDQWARLKPLLESRVSTEDEASRRRFALKQAEANKVLAQAELAKTEAGGWALDVGVQEAAVRAAEAELTAAKAKLLALEVDLDRLTVRAPVDGTVLRVNARKGQYVPAGGVSASTDGAVVLGDIEHLHVRVDIDETDVARFDKTAKAVAFSRGATRIALPLEFVRIEPYVIPKRQLTGASNERVDTRVLQVIYRIDKGDRPLFVGQQMDVFIESGR